MKRSIALILVTGAFMVSGCSGSGSDASSSTTTAPTDPTTFSPGVIPTMPPGGEVDIDPCTLLSREEAEAEFGSPLIHQDVGDQFSMVCAYTRPVDTEVGNPSEGVRLEIQTSAVYDHVKGAQAANDEMGIVMTPIAGIGDDAYLQETGPTMQLGFKSGDIAVYVKVDDSTSSKDESIEAMENLAGIVVERI